MLDGFKCELGARKTAISNAKLALESTYAKTMGKNEKAIQEDGDLVNEINGHLAQIEAAFNSFNGTIKSIKTAIDSSLILICRYLLPIFLAPAPYFIFGKSPSKMKKCLLCATA